MKAVFATQYGSPDVLHIREVATPTPKANEILVRVRAAPVAFGEVIARDFRHVSPSQFNMPMAFWAMARLAFGLNTPKKHILGSQFAGDVADVGSGVTHYKRGDAVFGYRGQSMGTHAEYVCIAEDGFVAPKPANMNYAEASGLPYGGLTALNLLRKANIQPGQKVLILGASGSIGSAAIQLARHAGAQVTAVCSSAGLAYVKALGAEHTIDYTKEDFTRNGQKYDLIFDVLGKGSFAEIQRSLTPNGVYLLASFKMKQVFQMLRTSRSTGKKVVCALSSEKPADILELKALAEAGVLKSIIDTCLPLEQAAEAHRMVESGHKKGSVILTLAAV
ncbi:MAG: NAD(P)-dependent alcohol dehydrogenase [Pleurocapsa minor GSE-CHR-MK-17-07R]|jgi:NADPH:quinone reductase-like Zn-dependent oxidoreductase|nr:NAD(P)-dependent alcohol dehydrogenase [Pleurocapsa minor GSE-CHR-MK 17-07R]